MSSKADTRANYIDPALKAAHWQPGNIIREHTLPMAVSLLAVSVVVVASSIICSTKTIVTLQLLKPKKSLSIQPKVFNKP